VCDGSGVFIATEERDSVVRRHNAEVVSHLWRRWHSHPEAWIIEALHYRTVIKTRVQRFIHDEFICWVFVACCSCFADRAVIQTSYQTSCAE